MNRLNLRLAAALLRVFGGASLDRDFERTRQLRAICDAKDFCRTGHRICLSAAESNSHVRRAPNELASASGFSTSCAPCRAAFATAIRVGRNRRTDYHHAVLTEHIRNSSDAWTQYQRSVTHGISATGGVPIMSIWSFPASIHMGVNDVFICWV